MWISPWHLEAGSVFLRGVWLLFRRFKVVRIWDSSVPWLTSQYILTFELQLLAPNADEILSAIPANHLCACAWMPLCVLRDGEGHHYLYGPGTCPSCLIV